MSFAPHAIVDKNGDFYSINLYYFPSGGPDFQITKITSSGISSSSHLYPWDRDFDGCRYVCGKSPVFRSVAESEFSEGFHNCLCPCIAEEMDTCEDYIYVFTLLPPMRLAEYYRKGGSTYTPEFECPEGLLSFKIKKSDLQIEKWNLTGHRSLGDDCDCLWFGKQAPRIGYWGNASPRFGNYLAYCVHDKVVCLVVSAATKAGTDHLIYNKNLQFIEHGLGSADMGQEFKRFIYNEKSKNVWFTGLGAGYWFTFTKMDKNFRFYSGDVMPFYIWLESTAYGASTTSYQHDFFVLDHPTDETKKIFCVIGFKSAHMYTNLKSSFKWCSPYITWSTNYSVLYLQSMIGNTQEVYWRYDYRTAPSVYPKMHCIIQKKHEAMAQF